jgi:hypothetical protein
MEKKVCTKCKEEKELSEFNKGRSECRLCSKEYKKEYYENSKDKIKKGKKEYRENNKDKIKEYDKEYKQNNKDKLKEYDKEYKQNNKDKVKEYGKEYRGNNKDKMKEYNKEYRENNKDKIKEYNKVRRQSDSLYKLTTNIRNLLKQSFRLKGYTKKTKSYKILGCTYEEFKTQIESQWEEWMNWDNYGKYNGEERYGWDLDHIIPVSSGKCVEDIIRLNHHSNLQPLCSYVNRCVKRDKIN